ncbi:MAG: response regulator, partial [Pseudomonadota bacterium]
RQVRKPLDLTVLCIDNEPAITDSMSILLRNWGCRVLIAQSRRQALGRILSAIAALNAGEAIAPDARPSSGKAQTGRDTPAPAGEASPAQPSSIQGKDGLSDFSSAQLERLGTHGPDIILADYHLDDGTGVATIAALKEKFSRDSPSVIITADQSGEVQREIKAQGAAVLRKPIKPASLRALMMRLQNEVVR